MDIPVPEAQGADEGKGKGKETAPRLTYDAQWLAITRAFFPFLTLAYGQRNFPTEEEARELISAAREVIVERALARGEQDIDDLEVERVQQFVMTAPGPGREDETGGPNTQRGWCFTFFLAIFLFIIFLRCSAVVHEPADAAVVRPHRGGEPYQFATEKRDAQG